jgi:MFS family permease
MPGMQTITAATIAGAMSFGMALALFGRLKLIVAQSVPAGDISLRRWLLALNVSLIPLMMLSGILLDIYGARALLVAGSVMLAVALVIGRPTATPPHTLTAMLLAGFGASAVGAASIVLMPHAFFVSEETSAGLNLGFVFIALGALLASVLADILLKTLQLRRSLAVCALLALTPAFLGVLPGATWRMDEYPAHLSTLFAEPACWLAALSFFFYVPLEASIGLWTFTLLAERGRDEREATGLLSGFWTALLASRLLAALLRHTVFYSEWWDRGLIVAAPLLAAVLLGNLAGAGQQGRPRGGLLLLGLLLGPVVPTLLSVIFQEGPDVKGTAFGVMFAAGSLGSVLLAPLLKAPSTVRRPLSALRLPIFLALLVTASALVLGLVVL